MLNSVLVVGVPVVALLAAAFYIFKRTQAETASHGCEGQGTSNYRQPWGSAPPGTRQSTTNTRRRIATRTRRSGYQHSNSSTNNDAEASSSSSSPSYESPDSGFPEEDQCEICFIENVAKVRLYPCKHSDLCVTCVHKLLISDKRQCPFCRSRIDGYEDVDTGQRFG